MCHRKIVLLSSTCASAAKLPKMQRDSVFTAPWAAQWLQQVLVRVQITAQEWKMLGVDQTRRAATAEHTDCLQQAQLMERIMQSSVNQKDTFFSWWPFVVLICFFFHL